MLVIGALTFGQEIWKGIITAFATAALVTVAGGFIANLFSRTWETRRETFELKTKLLDQVARTAQTMYVTCQHTRRVLRDNYGNTPDEITRREQILATLDDAYLAFSADATALETVLGARYGIYWSPQGEKQDGAKSESDKQGDSAAEGSSSSQVFWRWHQIWDLLTIYYFNLKGSFPGKPDVLQTNSKGYGGKYHTGLDLELFVNNVRAPEKDELRKMRGALRRAYLDALPKLAKSIVAGAPKIG
jgi:hypothetical protein